MLGGVGVRLWLGGTMERPRVPFSAEGGDMTDPIMVEEYEQLVGRFPWPRLARRIARQATGTRGEPPSTLLDVACGPGHLLEQLAEVLPDARLEGLDISDPMLGRATNRLRHLIGQGRVKLHRGSAYDMPIEDSTYDAVVCTDALHSFEQPAELLAEMLRVARPGGAVIVHAWRRDMAAPIWQLAHLQTWWLTRHGSHLGGGGAVADASYTAEEVRSAAALAAEKAGGADFAVTTGVVGLVMVMRKAGAPSAVSA